MDVAEMIIDSAQRHRDDIVRIMMDLTDEELHHQPRHDCNSIAWMGWHMAREADFHFSNFSKQEQAWVAEGWHARFGLEPDPKNRGLFHTPEQVSAFHLPDVQTLLDYYDAILARNHDYLASLTPADLAADLDESQREDQPVTMGTRMVSVMEELCFHMGQIAYVRGLIQGKGWQRY